MATSFISGNEKWHKLENSDKKKKKATESRKRTPNNLA